MVIQRKNSQSKGMKHREKKLNEIEVMRLSDIRHRIPNNSYKDAQGTQ